MVCQTILAANRGLFRPEQRCVSMLGLRLFPNSCCRATRRAPAFDVRRSFRCPRQLIAGRSRIGRQPTRRQFHDTVCAGAAGGHLPRPDVAHDLDDAQIGIEKDQVECKAHPEHVDGTARCNPERRARRQSRTPQQTDTAAPERICPLDRGGDFPSALREVDETFHACFVPRIPRTNNFFSESACL